MKIAGDPVKVANDFNYFLANTAVRGVNVKSLLTQMSTSPARVMTLVIRCTLLDN